MIKTSYGGILLVYHIFRYNFSPKDIQPKIHHMFGNYPKFQKPLTAVFTRKKREKMTVFCTESFRRSLSGIIPQKQKTYGLTVTLTLLNESRNSRVAHMISYLIPKSPTHRKTERTHSSEYAPILVRVPDRK